MTIFNWIIVGSWAVFILFWFVSAFNVKRDIKQNAWRRFVWLRIAILAVVVSYFWKTQVSNHFVIFQFSSQNPLLAGIGAALSVMGIGLAVWARVHLGRNWSPVPTLKEGHELVTSGPYALIRHPIYTGIILAALGSAFASVTWMIVFIIITLVFVWRVKREESLMMQQFPNQYPEYKKHTWALFPYIF